MYGAKDINRRQPCNSVQLSYSLVTTVYSWLCAALNCRGKEAL